MNKSMRDAGKRIPEGARRLGRRSFLKTLAAAGLAGAALPGIAGCLGATGARPSSDATEVEPTRTKDESVIFVAAPKADDPYYAPFREKLLDFDSAFVEAAGVRDRVIVVADKPALRELRDRVPERNLLSGDIADVWVRDVGPIQAGDRLIKFLYRPRNLAKADARYIDEAFRRWLQTSRLKTRTVDLVLDGGNFVQDGSGQAVITERVFSDNRRMSPGEVVATLKRELSLERLAVVPEESGDVLGHADGMVAWLTPDTLAVSSFREPFRSKVRRALDRALPEVRIVEIPYQPSSKTWRGIPSAQGVYANALSTPGGFYAPVYGAKKDAEAIRLYGENLSQPVVEVDSARIAQMGGAVRCLSWDLRGVVARKVLETLG